MLLAAAAAAVVAVVGLSVNDARCASPTYDARARMALFYCHLLETPIKCFTALAGRYRPRYNEAGRQAGSSNIHSWA